MIPRHIALMRELCGSYAYLLMKKPQHDYKFGILVVRGIEIHEHRVSKETLYKWVTEGYIELRAQEPEIYTVTRHGRTFIADLDEPDRPLSMASITRAQQLARTALRNEAR